MKQTIRIIGGQFKGKKISFLDLDELRPTPNRVRETLFNWLMYDIRGARCLDAFAGSGALGLEAFSRGAKEVVFVESSPKVYAYLKQTIDSFNTPSLTVINSDADVFLKQNTSPFDIIFLDPPFLKHHLKSCLDQLAHSNLLAPRGLVYIESPCPLTLDTSRWNEKKAQQAGQVFYSLYEKVNF